MPSQSQLSTAYLAPPPNTYKSAGQNSIARQDIPMTRLTRVAPAAHESRVTRMTPSDIRDASHTRHINRDAIRGTGTRPTIEVSDYDLEAQRQRPQRGVQTERVNGTPEVRLEPKPKKFIKFNSPFFINTGAFILCAVVFGLLGPGIINNIKSS